MKAKTRQLAALHATVVLLRAALQRLKLTAKLRAALADPAAAASALDLAKAAKLASDVDAVGRDADLEGLTAIEADAEFLRSAGQQIRGHAEVRCHVASSGGSNARVVACTTLYCRLLSAVSVHCNANSWTDDCRVRRSCCGEAWRRSARPRSVPHCRWEMRQAVSEAVSLLGCCTDIVDFPTCCRCRHRH